jgi:hypothetical protein
MPDVLFLANKLNMQAAPEQRGRRTALVLRTRAVAERQVDSAARWAGSPAIPARRAFGEGAGRKAERESESGEVSHLRQYGIDSRSRDGAGVHHHFDSGRFSGA